MDFEEWELDCKKALDWFIEIIGSSEWVRRRKNVVNYFNSIRDSSVDSSVKSSAFTQSFKPVAFYDDWMSWYMYLIESIFERPLCYDPFQAARIYPFFAKIGRHVDILKQIKGIDRKLASILNEKQNKPDSTLFELAIAISYYTNGWTVRFIEEVSNNKSADLEVIRGHEKYYVECKRLAKITEYCDFERAEWLKRWRHLCSTMQRLNMPIHADIVFKIPVEDTPENILGKTILHYISSGHMLNGSVMSLPELDFSARMMDLKSANEHLIKFPVKANSPMLIHVLTGNYSPHGSYTQGLKPSLLQNIGEGEELYVLSELYAGIEQAYSAKWECIADASIDKKAKDIKKLLSKAISQIPDNEKGIIHIGYETVTGIDVEFKRARKIREIIQSFDYIDKDIDCIFCHGIQPLADIDKFECAETTMYWGANATHVLPNMLIVDAPNTEIRNTTHWEEDFLNQ